MVGTSHVASSRCEEQHRSPVFVGIPPRVVAAGTRAELRASGQAGAAVRSLRGARRRAVSRGVVSAGVRRRFRDAGRLAPLSRKQASGASMCARRAGPLPTSRSLRTLGSMVPERDRSACVTRCGSDRTDAWVSVASCVCLVPLCCPSRVPSRWTGHRDARRRGGTGGASWTAQSSDGTCRDACLQPTGRRSGRATLKKARDSRGTAV